ncbi:hypothetical protein KUTeg_008797 [Tegillarca granosa]|uniref:Uncharacterized protein n=1 Tax=Tegillarca granosa TaxID=220873 RepID=A0ABQ9FC95_TEGGR|nr:hypothetical protein KUTeg_008797 [Tegillarca granosa]
MITHDLELKELFSNPSSKKPINCFAIMGYKEKRPEDSLENRIWQITFLHGQNINWKFFNIQVLPCVEVPHFLPLICFLMYHE